MKKTVMIMYIITSMTTITFSSMYGNFSRLFNNKDNQILILKALSDITASKLEKKNAITVRLAGTILSRAFVELFHQKGFITLDSAATKAFKNDFFTTLTYIALAGSLSYFLAEKRKIKNFEQFLSIYSWVKLRSEWLPELTQKLYAIKT